MTNDELKKKILGILDQATGDWYEKDDGLFAEGYTPEEGDNRFKAFIADALIAAGIGDVTEWKEKAKKHRVQVLPDGTIKQLYSDEEVEDIARQRDEYKHRAEVAERALCNACKDIKDICEYLVKIGETGVITIESYAPEQSEPSAYIDRAEKELAEERKDD